MAFIIQHVELDVALEHGWPIKLVRTVAVSSTSTNGTITHPKAIHAIPAAIMWGSTLAAVAVSRPVCHCYIDSLACGAFVMWGLVVAQAVQVAAAERP